ncbi:MAG TPA: LLM class F420-dependent oxidoreductase [Blastocatellia bacterium]|nr:LLM class F420-dependent oxidoreductase [Blastocatellia bacterium]
MKLGILFCNAGPLVLPENARALAEVAEASGFESVWTVEHVVIPVGYSARYPYSETGRMPAPDDVPIADPLVFLSYLAGVTKTLKLATGILILPQRHPAYVAKEVATLDLLSGGRALLGVGIGWLKDEFDALGLSFADRAARTEEAIRAIRTLWAKGPQAFEGRFFRWGPVESNPKPVQQPGVPIIVGGHVENAARRAARLGDGFFPGRSRREDLLHLLAAMRDECQKIGRNADEIEITVGATGPLTLDQVRRFQELGVSRIVIPPPGFDRESLVRGLTEIAEQIIAKMD